MFGMPRKIKYDIDVYKFLMDLNSKPDSGYETVIRKIHAIAKNPKIRGSVQYSFGFDVEVQDGKEVMLFTQCRNVEVHGFTITYTWSDKDEDSIYITEIYDHGM
jgi:hypothetical protein